MLHEGSIQKCYMRNHNYIRCVLSCMHNNFNLLFHLKLNTLSCHTTRKEVFAGGLNRFCRRTTGPPAKGAPNIKKRLAVTAHGSSFPFPFPHPIQFLFPINPNQIHKSITNSSRSKQTHHKLTFIVTNLEGGRRDVAASTILAVTAGSRRRDRPQPSASSDLGGGRGGTAIRPAPPATGLPNSSSCQIWEGGRGAAAGVHGLRPVAM